MHPWSNTRADSEEGRLEVVLVQVVEKVGCVQGRAIVVGKTPSELGGAARDVGITDATTASPPATARVACKLRVCGAPSGLGGLEVGDGDARRVDLLDPLLNLRGVGGRGLIESWVVGG